MKKTLLHTMAMLALCTGITTHAYWWRFNNFTTKTLLLKVKLLASNNPYYAIVHPEMSVLFDWSAPNFMAGFCFGGVLWTEVPSEILNNNNLVDNNHQVINNQLMNTMFYGDEAPFKLEKGELIFLPLEIYKKTVHAARAALPFLSSAIKWLAKKYAQSPCASRNISIIEDENEEISFYTLAH